MRFRLTLICSLFFAVSFAAKVDTIYMLNTNVITGEVKSLDLGKLSYKVDGMGTLKVEWDKITGIISRQLFFIQTNYETIYYGSLAVSENPGKDLIIMAYDTLEVNHIDIVSVAPLKKTFWENLDGYASLGFNFTKANNSAQLTGDFQGVYRARLSTTELTSQIILKDQSNTDPSRKEDVNLTYSRITSGPRFWSTSISFEQNTELNLKLRSKISAYTGRKFINTNYTKLAIYAGAAGNNETNFSSTEPTYNAELLAGISFNTYRYDDPELNISASFIVYQGINNTERRRFDFNVSARWEILNDLFFSLTFYDNFDGQAPSTNAVSNDYGMVSSLGYSF